MRGTKTLGAVYIYIYIDIFMKKLNHKLIAKENLVLFAVQKLYIKYKKIKDVLLKIIICPFCVQKEEMNSS